MSGIAQPFSGSQETHWPVFPAEQGKAHAVGTREIGVVAHGGVNGVRLFVVPSQIDPDVHLIIPVGGKNLAYLQRSRQVDRLGRFRGAGDAGCPGDPCHRLARGAHRRAG